MTEKLKTLMTKPSDRELVFTRTFNAPRELVWQAWTDPKHVAQWWGPEGFTTTTREMDVKAGGVWRLTMHGPDGVDYKNRIVYLEVTKPSRLVYTTAGEDKDEHVKFQATVSFDEIGNQTRLTMQMCFKTPAELAHVIEKYGADKGAIEHIDRLEAHLATMA